jgi:hypothetical protein
MGDERPFVIVGDKIDPDGRKKTGHGIGKKRL